MDFSLSLENLPIVVVDVETTGASAEWGDRVIELGVARVEGGKVVSQFQQLIDPGKRISATITAITGITNDMLAGQPNFPAVWEQARSLFDGAIILGHNVLFDISFLRKELLRLGIAMQEHLNAPPIVDTVQIARRRFGRGGNALQTLAARLGVDSPIAHRALADVMTTFGVFEKMIEVVGGWNLTLDDLLSLQGGLIDWHAVARRSPLPSELEEALLTGGRVLMQYLDIHDQRTERIIQPHEVRRIRGTLTLVAHCHLRNARRMFKLERIVSLTRVQEPQ